MRMPSLGRDETRLRGEEMPMSVSDATERGCLLALLFMCCSAAAWAVPGDEVVFNHKESAETAYTRPLRDGEKLTIRITDTCPSRFTYEVRGVRDARPGSSAAGKLGEMLLEVDHDDVFGGYIVNISERKNSTSCDADLKPTTFIVFTPASPWALSLTGGFTVSGLTDPVYALSPDPSEPARRHIVEDSGKEDVANMGAATFVHIYHARRPSLALLFGLGLGEFDETEYYLGGGWRLSDKATFNVGLALGSVARLPAGLGVGQSVMEDNVLADLPKRRELSWFFGVTFSFLDVGADRFKKPFAGSAEE